MKRADHVRAVSALLLDMAEACRVTLDAWLEAPRLSRNNVGWMFDDRRATGTLDEYGKREAAIRALINLLELGGKNHRWVRKGWFYMGREPIIGMRFPTLLSTLYTDLRGDYVGVDRDPDMHSTWHHRLLRASFGYEDPIVAERNDTDIMTPAWVGKEFLRAPQEARDHLDKCFAHVMTCLRDTWNAVAAARAALGGSTSLQRDFLVWAAELQRPIQHVEVKRWMAVKRGRPADYNWGANDPAGPLLRRFCAKQGPPGSRAPWVLRPEAIASLGQP